MLKASLLVSILLLVSTFASAQFTERITSGRPGNSNETRSVGKGVYQIQTGFNFIEERMGEDDLDGTLARNREIQSVDAMFRIGINHLYELRIFSNYVFNDEQKFSKENSIDQSGLERFAIGMRRVLINESKGIIPLMCIQLTADLGGLNEYESEKTDAILRLNMSNRISDRFGLNYNIAHRFNAEESKIQTFYILSFSFSATENLSLCAEGFGTISESSNSFSGGTGLAYIIGNNFQIDLYGSYGNNYLDHIAGDQAILSLTTGISYRIVNR